MTAKRTWFTALASVLFCYGLSSITGLSAQVLPTKSETAASDEGGKLVGILTHFEYNWTKAKGPKPDTRLSLKAEGETESVDYLLALPNEAVDSNLEAALQKVCPSNTVSMQWELRNDKRLVTKIAVLSPTSGQGTIVGTVMACGKGSLDLKGLDRRAVTTRYVAAWDPQTKGQSPAVISAIQGLEVGDKVKIAWSANAERPFVNQVTLISRAKSAASATAPKKSTATKP